MRNRFSFTVGLGGVQSCALHRTISGGARHTHKSRHFRRRVLSSLHELDEVSLLRRGELRFFVLEASSSLRDRHAFACPLADEVCFEPGDHAEYVEQLAHGVGGVMNRSSDGKSCPSLLDLVDDVGRIVHGSRESIQFGHHEGVAAAQCCERLA